MAPRPPRPQNRSFSISFIEPHGATFGAVPPWFPWIPSVVSPRDGGEGGQTGVERDSEGSGKRGGKEVGRGGGDGMRGEGECAGVGGSPLIENKNKFQFSIP